MRKSAVLVVVGLALALTGCGTAALVGSVVDTAAGAASTVVDVVTSPVR